MNRYSFFLLALLAACSSQRSSTSAQEATGDTRRTPVSWLDADTYHLTVASTDKTYGYKKENPIKVGGAKESSGPANERRFLNGLLGPGGEAVRYHRRGSCCPFKTPNGYIDNTGLLDMYEVYYDGAKDTLILYLNMYDKGDLLIPIGFTAKN